MTRTSDYDISILLPAIRPERWVDFYKSVEASIDSHVQFEIIFVSPVPLPKELENISNVKYITDFGSPTRCFNIALENAENPLVTWAADDGLYRPGMLKKAIQIYEDRKRNQGSTVLALGQIEAGNQYDRDFVRINKHPPLRSEFIDDSFIFFPTAIMERELLDRMQGLDCRFNGHAMAHVDLAIRVQGGGYAKVEFLDEICLDLSHMMGTSGDHAPMHHSQLQEDEPLFRELYKGSHPDRIFISNKKSLAFVKIINWRAIDNVWKWRFKRSV
jgi:hypothetical protein